MTNPCFDDIARVFKNKTGQSISTEQADQIYKRIKDGIGDSTDPNLIGIAVQEATEDLRSAFQAKRNAILNKTTELKFVDYVRTNFKGKEELGIEALLVGVNKVRDGSRLSVDARQKALAGKYFEGMEAHIRRKGLWADFVSGELDDDIARELWSFNKDGAPATKNKNARSIAETVYKFQEVARGDANSAGANIGKLSNYITRQSHDMYRIRGKSSDEWVDFILPLLDNKTFRASKDLSTKAVRAELKKLHVAFASGVHLKIDEGAVAPIDFSKLTNAGKKISESRELIFKDADSWTKYNKEFGAKNLRESVLSSFTRLADQTGLMRTLGPNYKNNLERIVETLSDDAIGRSDIKTVEKLRNRQTKFNSFLSELDGSVSIPGNAVFARVGAVARAVQSMAKLGGALITSVSDVPTTAATLRYNGKGLLSSYHDALLGTGLKGAKRKELAAMIGIYSDATRADVGARFSFREDLPGKMSKSLQTFFKYNGLTWWTDRMRTNAGLSLSTHLGMNASKSFDALPKQLQSVFKTYNIGDAEWKVIRQGVDEVDGGKYLTPEAIQNLPDSAFKDLEVGARDRLDEAIRAYYIDQSEHAVITPDARTLAFLRSGTQAGTVPGEFMRMIMQFKAFPIAYTQKVLGRQFNGHGYDSFAQAVKAGDGDLIGLAHIIAMSTVFGYMSMSAKDILKGREPRDPLDPATMTAAFLQGGGGGIGADFLLGTSNRYGGDLLQSLAGPALGTISDLKRVVDIARDGKSPAAAGFNVLLSNTPFMNLFYTRVALDYLVLFQMKEMLSPGHLRRVEDRVEKENNQEFFLKPSRAIPRGGGSRIFEGIRE